MQRLWTIGILLLVTRTPALAQTEQFLKELLGNARHGFLYIYAE